MAFDSNWGPLINVLTLGVKGDGVTDDGPRINTAITQFAGKGQGLFFPTTLADGRTLANYLITTFLVPRSHINLVIDENGIINSNLAGVTTADGCTIGYTFAGLATGATTVAATQVLFSDLITLTSVAGIVANVTYVGIFDAALGVRGGLYKVIALPGGNVIQVDRPVLWPFKNPDGVSIFNGLGPDGVTNNPSLQNFNVIGLGEGAIFEGQCVAYMNLVGAMNCGIKGLKGQKGGAGTTLSSDAGFAFQIGYRNWQENIFIDGNSHNSPNKGMPLVAQEAFVSRNFTANGCDVANIGVNDCVDSDFFVTKGLRGGFGMVLGTETAAVSGIQANRWVRFWGLTLTDNVTGGLAFGVGDSFNLINGFLIGGSGGAGVDLNSGANLTPCQQNKMCNGVIQRSATIGLHLPNHAIQNTFVNVDVQDSLSQDVMIEVGATDNSFDGLGIYNTVAASARFESHDDVIVRRLTAVCTVASTGAVEVFAGTCFVDGAFVTLGANSDAFFVPGGVLAVANVKSYGSNAGTTGIQTNGGTARVGSNCDFNAYGAAFLNSAGFFSRAQVVANGTTPVVVPWPDLKSTDRVTLILRTASPAAPVLLGTPQVTYTPGASFTVTGMQTLDASTYDYIVE